MTNNFSNLPKLPTGSILPQPEFISDTLRELEEIKRQQEIKKEHAHDYKVAVFSALLGGIAGFVTSIIFWLITK